MTNEQLEQRLINLEKMVANLAERQGNRANESEGKANKNASDISDANACIEENTENISTANSVTDMILTEVITDIEGNHDDLVAIVDMILTEVIPELMGDE